MLKRTVVVLFIVFSACARPIVWSPDAIGVVVVTVTKTLGDNIIGEESTSSPPFKIGRRPSLPRIVLPYTREAGMLYAAGSGRFDIGPVLFAIDENPFMRTASVIALDVSAPIENYAGMRESLAQYEGVVRQPCMAVSGFFIRGVGVQPGEPVVLTAKHGARWGTTVVDPALHTLDLRPVVRIPPHGEDLPVEAHISVAVASNSADFIVLAITRRPEGYVAFSFLASRQRYGWNRVPEDGETLFYVIDDPVSYRSGCREGPVYGSGEPT